ncbi:hypothetical protein [Sulfurimonas sp.]|uniref:hypothetical protein n=1 Tax=Sulfurimonas sp. TaxID=2022749 RepID=UPI003D132FF3
MKKIVFMVFLFVLILNADDMQRLDEIVKDIENLRISYDKSQDSLNKCQIQLHDQQEKNMILQKELKNESTETYMKSINVSDIENLKNQIKNLKKQIKNKDNEILLLKNKNNKIMDNQIKKENTLENEINNFPELKMRKQPKLVDNTPTTYRLTQESIIYSGIDGVEVDKWEKSTSFTSKLKTAGWIKISGYFVDKKWQKVQKDMWVKTSQAFKRD